MICKDSDAPSNDALGTLDDAIYFIKQVEGNIEQPTVALRYLSQLELLVEAAKAYETVKARNAARVSRPKRFLRWLGFTT